MSSIAASVQNVLPSIERHGNFIRDSWDRLSSVPGGKSIFSRLVGIAAPYTGSMGARVVELRRGHARVELADRRKVRNHLDCIHAIALANLAELTGNVAVAYTLPDDARFIVAGMSIEYLQKARGTIVGTAECPLFASSEKAEHEVPVSMKNRKGEEVARATLRTLVGPKKKR
ncbi:MAG TPA: hotdog fold domain-containing protein [Sandaracinaceae bacterium LLY-WYZ-13_1]|nr:hotdog fold domain-containing protein [Sandaracinaceae bacterium LLY-WYZ-13_1]